MRGIGVGAASSPRADEFVVTIGVSGNQVGFSSFIPIGVLSKATWKTLPFRDIRVDNVSGIPQDQVHVNAVGIFAQNAFNQMILHGSNNEIITFSTKRRDTSPNLFCC